MATLTSDELTAARRRAARNNGVAWTKPQINAALQAIEDAMVSTGNVGARSVRQHISQAIEAAASGVFSAGQKDDLFICWAALNAARGGIL